MRYTSCRRALLAAALTASPVAAQAKDAYVKLGITLTSLADHGITYANGTVVPGSDYSTNSVESATLTGGYFFRDHFALEVSVNSPSTVQNLPGGTLAGTPSLGDETFVTTDVIANYHPLRGELFSPYIGIGVRHHFTTKGTDGIATTNFRTGSGTGMVLQGGVDYNFSNDLSAFVELKKAYYNIISSGNLGPENVAVHAKLDPVSVQFGMAYRFGSDTTVSNDYGTPGRWFLRAGASRLSLSNKLNMTVGGAPYPGATLKTDSHYSPSIEVGWNIDDSFAAVATLGLPPTIDASGGGTVAALGKLSQVTYGPTSLTLQYHILNTGFFRPYVGAGASYLMMFKSTDASVVTNIHMTRDLAPVVEAGADFMVNGRYGFYVEAKKSWLGTTATGSLLGNPLVAHAPIHPLVISLGTVFRL
jgi:outer membrane protein